jgi:GMP synthase-like glutamine amidotransferase
MLPSHCTRRTFLKVLAASAVSLGLAGCQADAPRAPDVSRAQPAPVPARRTSAKEKNGMIWYVDIEHEDAVADPVRAPGFDQVRNQRARVLEDVAQTTCEPILYRQVTPELLQAQNVGALALSGSTSDWAQYDFSTFDTLKQIVTGGDVPVIGLCGGEQLLAYFYGGDCGPLRRLEPGEAEIADWAPGWFKEVGYLPVSVINDDPIFAGLGPNPTFFESHYWQITQLPQDFDNLASTPECAIQVVKHKRQLVYGTQFHPEVNSAEHRDGRKLLANFFRLAGILKA